MILGFDDRTISCRYRYGRACHRSVGAYLVVFAVRALESRRKRFAGRLVLLLACIESAMLTVSSQPLIVSFGAYVYLMAPLSCGAGGGCSLQASIFRGAKAVISCEGR